MMQLVSIEGGRVDYEDFEECGALDFYGPLCMLDMMEDVCIGLTDTPVVSNRGTDLEKAMTQVRKTSLFSGNCHACSERSADSSFGCADGV